MFGFKIYKISDTINQALDADFFRNHKNNIVTSNYASFGNENIYSEMREKTGWFTMEPGAYMIIPAIFEPNVEGLFLLRIFADVKYEFKAL